MAYELSLNLPPHDTMDDREKLNRTRTWLNCFCVDGSYATQFGKVMSISQDDYVARTSRDWYMLSPLNQLTDIHLCGYVHANVVMCEFRATICKILRENQVRSNVTMSPNRC